MADEKTISLRDMELRMVDKTSGTPLFCRIHFIDGTLTVPGRRPRPDETLVLNQGKADSLMHFRVESDQKTFEPLPISMSALIHMDKTINDTLQVLSNPDDAGTWTVGGSTFVTETTTGATDNAEGTSVNHVLPQDEHRAKYLMSLEMKLTSTSGGTDHVVIWELVHWENFDYKIGNPATLDCSGMIYGGISRATSFTAATEIS